MNEIPKPNKIIDNWKSGSGCNSPRGAHNI